MFFEVHDCVGTQALFVPMSRPLLLRRGTATSTLMGGSRVLRDALIVMIDHMNISSSFQSTWRQNVLMGGTNVGLRRLLSLCLP